MTGFELVAGVIGIFFCCGIALGVVIVIVLGRDDPRQEDKKPPRRPGG